MPRPRFLSPLLLVLAVLTAACGGANNNANKNAATAAVTVPVAVTVRAQTTTAVTAQGATPATTATPAVLGSPGPAPTAAPVSGAITVFAAASLTDAFNELGVNFQKANPNAKVTFNFAASSALRTQLQQGAKGDLFASADQATMDGAKADGSIDGPDQLFVKNKLVVIFPTSNPGKIGAIQDLARPGLKFVLTDKSVPIGSYARQALAKMAADPGFGADFDQKALANLKSEEANVRAVVSKVQLGEADVAITYASDVTPAVTKDVQSLLIPDQFNVIATYPIAVVKGASNKAAAQAFIAYVRSSAGQDVLKKNNFIVDRDTGAAAHLPARGPERLAQRQASGYSASVALGGAVANPRSYTADDLQALPAQTVEVQYQAGATTQQGAYTGVRLYDLLMAASPQLDTAHKNDLLRSSILVTGSDGYEVVIAWGEIDPGFENKAVLVAYQEDGQPLGPAEGMAWLVVPGDQKGGRYVSNVVSITLLKPAE